MKLAPWSLKSQIHSPPLVCALKATTSTRRLYRFLLFSNTHRFCRDTMTVDRDSRYSCRELACSKLVSILIVCTSVRYQKVPAQGQVAFLAKAPAPVCFPCHSITLFGQPGLFSSAKPPFYSEIRVQYATRARKLMKNILWMWAQSPADFGKQATSLGEPNPNLLY